MTTCCGASGVARTFGALRAVDGVDLTVAAGARHALIGPNGAGKSTLLRLIAGGTARSPAAEIWLDGRDVTGEPEARRARLGIGQTFQQSSLFRTLTAADNVALAVQRRRGRPWLPVPSRPAWAARVDELLALRRPREPRRSHRVDTLSYAECRQLEVAVALAAEPQVLLLDEPAAGMSAAEHRPPARPAPRAAGRDHADLRRARPGPRVRARHRGHRAAPGPRADVRHARPRCGPAPRCNGPTSAPAGARTCSSPSPEVAMSLHVRDLRSGYRQGEVLHGVDLDVDARPHAGRARPQRRRQEHPAAHADGSGPADQRQRPARRPGAGRRPGRPDRPRRHRAGAAGPPDLAHRHRARAPRPGRAAGAAPRRGPSERLFDLFPGLAARRRHVGGLLSGGEQQMLAMARALITGPSVVLLDEPSEGLAPAIVDRGRRHHPHHHGQRCRRHPRRARPASRLRRGRRPSPCWAAAPSSTRPPPRRSGTTRRRPTDC